MVKVFDLRTLRALPPISYPPGPYMLSFHPRFSSTLLIAAQQGVFQFAEVGNTATMPDVFQVGGAGSGAVLVSLGCSPPDWADPMESDRHGPRRTAQMDTAGNVITSMDISSTGQVTGTAMPHRALRCGRVSARRPVPSRC